jgi:hypothetical protein
MKSFVLAALLGQISADHANDVNPFLSKTIYPNPTFTSNVKQTAADHSDEEAILEATELIGAATWIDSMENIKLIEPILKGA